MFLYHSIFIFIILMKLLDHTFRHDLLATQRLKRSPLFQHCMIKSLHTPDYPSFLYSIHSLYNAITQIKALIGAERIPFAPAVAPVTGYPHGKGFDTC